MMFSQSLTLGCITVLFPKVVSNVDLIYYGIAAIILAVFIFYAVLLPKKEAEVYTFSTQKNKEVYKAN
jgi:MFS transporter, DHA3 family, macrolide efflux protein